MSLKPIILFGEQKQVLFLPPTEPIQIKGVAGSGKTTVALYRAKHLLETQNNLFQESKVAIFTFNKTLTAYIEAVRPMISGGYQKDSDDIVNRSNPGLNVTVVNFHKWAYSFLTSRNIDASIDFNTFQSFQEQIVSELIASLKTNDQNSNILNKSEDFFLDEISWMKGKLFNDKGEYLVSPRTGRGTTDRVTKADREIIWNIFVGYNEKLRLAGKLDFDDYAVYCLKEINNDKSFIAPYSHIIIDEAQDLSKAQVLAISKLVSDYTKSITIIADSAQKIYKTGFTWTEVGIEVRGARTLSLKKNYRNTEAILLAANSLLSHDPDPSEFTKAEPARKGGEKPQLSYFSNFTDEMNHLIKELRKFNFDNSLTVILHRYWDGMRKISHFLINQGIANEIITRNSVINFENQKIKICTLSSVKGLEFDNVFILDVNDDKIPSPYGFNEINDEDHVATERRLLYTAMTRAKERLFLLSFGNPSRYLSEIDESLITKIGNSQMASVASNSQDFIGL